MKRVFVVAMLLLALVIPAATFAQDSTPQSAWVLNQTFTVTDLGFTFKFPEDWLSDSSNGITLATTKSDIAAASDNDDSTVPEGDVITLNATHVADLKAQVGSNPTLEDIADLIAKANDVKETESRVELPVMTRRSLSVIGNSQKDKRAGIATIWRQDDWVVVAALSAPSMSELVDLSYSWGQLIASMNPSDTLPLNSTPLQVTDGNFEINLPQKWYPKTDNPQEVFELKDDMKNDSFNGDIIIVGAQTLKDAGLTSKSTVDDLVDQNITTLGLEEPIRKEEFIILGQPAVTIRGGDDKNGWALVTQTIVDGDAITLAVIAPTEDKINAIEPTWISILQSVTAINAKK